MKKSRRLLALLALVPLIIVTFLTFDVYRNLRSLRAETRSLSEKQAGLEESYTAASYEDHLKLMEQARVMAEIDALKVQIETLSKTSENQDYLKIKDVYSSFELFSTKIDRNSKAGLDTKELSVKVGGWGEKLINKEYDPLLEEIDLAVSTLDGAYDKYQAELPKPTASTGEGYSYVTVDTEKGKFGVYLIKAALSSVRVVTAAANGDNCGDNCPTKSLADHVRDNGGYAGMNGAYFCPPDYSTCSGKVNSSDYAFYRSSSGKWLNKDALSWGDTGLATFNGHEAKFYKKSSDYGGNSVTAGISNYPTLLDNGEVVVDTGKLTSYQKDVRGSRGVIGVGKSNLYLAIVSNATVVDAAYVMKALGAEDALNLDGGGSSAMYINGSYIVGPGRSLPNAVVIANE